MQNRLQFKTDLDLAGDTTLVDQINFINQTPNVQIDQYVAFGPGGGNPQFFVSSNSRDSLVALLKSIDPDMADEDLVQQITE